MDSKEAMMSAFELFAQEEIPDQVLFHAAEIATAYPGNYENAKHEAFGFFSGWNAALQWASNKGFNLTPLVDGAS